MTPEEVARAAEARLEMAEIAPSEPPMDGKCPRCGCDIPRSPDYDLPLCWGCWQFKDHAEDLIEANPAAARLWFEELATEAAQAEEDARAQAVHDSGPLSPDGKDDPP